MGKNGCKSEAGPNQETGPLHRHITITSRGFLQSGPHFGNCTNFVKRQGLGPGHDGFLQQDLLPVRPAGRILRRRTMRLAADLISRSWRSGSETRWLSIFSWFSEVGLGLSRNSPHRPIHQLPDILSQESYQTGHVNSSESPGDQKDKHISGVKHFPSVSSKKNLPGKTNSGVLAAQACHGRHRVGPAPSKRSCLTLMMHRVRELHRVQRQSRI